MKLYHGSYTQVSEPRIIPPARLLDFGTGFYTTTDREQAVKFTLRDNMQSQHSIKKRKHARRLYRQACEIVQMIMRRYGVGEHEAIAEFYRSATYGVLANYETRIWWYSAPAIFEIYTTEKKTGSILNSPYILGEYA